MKSLTIQQQEAEARADEYERDLKSLQHKYTQLDGKMSVCCTSSDNTIIILLAELDQVQKKYEETKAELESTINELGEM